MAMIPDVMLVRSEANAAMLPYWDKTDAIVAGIDAMRRQTDFLPQFRGEDNDDYKNRLKFTKFTNVYGDALENLSSKPFEQEVHFVTDEEKALPDKLAQFAEDVDGAGNTLHTFAGQLFYHGINSAISWVFVDMPPLKPGSVISVAEAKASGVRAYWSIVLGRNVLEATAKMINSRETLTYMRIFEPGNPDHIRVFERLDTGAVIWTLYEKRKEWRTIEGKGQTQFYEVANGDISIGVIPLVPFFTGRRDGRTFRVLPPLKSGADLQVTLYQNECGLEWQKVLAGYSMLAGQGVRPQIDPVTKKPQPVQMGPGVALFAPPDKDGNAGRWEFIQPDPAVMTFLENSNKNTAEALRELMRQPLTAQSGNLTVITTSVAAAKTRSAVAAWAISLRNALENAAVITCKFENIGTDIYDPTVFVYTNFDEFTDGKDLETLDADRDRKDISRETLWEEKQRRGVYGPEFTAKREEERLQKERLADTPSDNGIDTGAVDQQGNPIQ